MAPPRFVIVGSGIAGLAAAETVRQGSANAQILMIGDEPHPFYSRPGLAYLLRGDIPESQLFIRRPEDLQSLNVQRICARAETILPERREVVLGGGHRLGYDRLLVAVGAQAAQPPFLPSPLPGAVKLDSLDDVRSILQQVRRGESAVVVGGGITALELAEGLLARRMDVHYFLRGDRYWSDVLDETESRIVMDRLAHEGMTLRLNTQVKRVLTENGQVAGVETTAGAVVRCRLLAYAIGVKPRLELAKASGLAVDRGIVVDAQLRTSAPDVFAAGDVAQVRNADGTPGALDVLWPTALAQGRIAGENMAGGQRPYLKKTPFNVTQLAGLKVTILGSVGVGTTQDLVAVARGDSETWRLRLRTFAVGERDDVDRVRLMVGPTRIAGAVVMGDQTWSVPLQRLIAEEADIRPIRPALEAGGAAALGQLATFYQRWIASRPRPVGGNDA